MTEDLNKKVDELQEEQLNEVSGGSFLPYDHVFPEPLGPAPGGQTPGIDTPNVSDSAAPNLSSPL